MRYYSSVCTPKTLAADFLAAASTITLSDSTGIPSFPFTLVVNPDGATEEIILVTSAAASPAHTFNVVRGTSTYDGVQGGNGTTAQNHYTGETVKHMVTARDLQEPQNHMAATSGVHGVTGDIVGTTASQTLTNKTISSLSGQNTVSVRQQDVQNLVSDLAAKAALASPAFTGTPTITGTPPANNTSDTKIATTAFVQSVADTKLDEPAGNGLAVRNGSGTSVNRNLASGAASTSSKQGLNITNEDGVAGNPTVTLGNPVQFGSSSVSVSSGTGSVTVTSATTTASSIIVATPSDENYLIAVKSLGTNTFTITIKHYSSGVASGTITVRWMVI